MNALHSIRPPDMRTAIYIALVAAAVAMQAAFCHGQEPFQSEPAPKIDGPASITLGQKAKLRVIGVSAAAKVVWSVPSALDSDDGHEVTPSGLLIFPTVPGQYVASAAVLDGEKLICLQFVTELKGARPPPGPGPEPDPVDDGKLKPGNSIIVVRESREQTKPMAMMLTALQSSLTEQEQRFFVVDPDDKVSGTNRTQLEDRGLDKIMAKAGVTAPCLIVLDPFGKSLGVGKLPGTEQECMAAVRKAVTK